jgi:D-hexose-6-phosphate mutarotase
MRLVSILLPPGVTLGPGRNGLPRVQIATAEATGEVYLHGAHVTAWQPAGATPVIWVSRDSLFAADKAIRGGVPICFPWFAAHATEASAPMHGFARLAAWQLADAVAAGGAVHLSFVLTDSEASRRSAWPHRFRAEFRVSVGARLGMALDVSNPGPAAFSYEAALHTYFAVGDIRRVTVTGLSGTDYLDKVDGFARKRQPDAPIAFTGETDRIYLDTEATTVIHDPALRRRVEVAKSGSQSTIVWNPWSERARALADFGDDQWPEMLCIETANVRERAVTLEAGSHHSMKASISLAAL